MDSPPTINVVNPRSSLPCIHRYYILLKGHYFLFFSAFGILYPVLSLILRSRGLSNIELSYINIIIPFLVFFMNPIMGFIADQSRRYLLTFNILFLIVTIVFSIMFVLPSIKSHNIKGDIFYDNELGRVLDFCASQEVATKCASRSQCGCAYQANCSLIDPLHRENDHHMNSYFFTFTMNSTKIYKEVRDVSDTSEKLPCGIEYRVPIDQAIEQYTQKHNLDPFSSTDSSSRLAICEITCSIAHYCHGSRYIKQMRHVVFYSLLFVAGTSFINNAISVGATIGFASLHRPELFGRQRLCGTIGFGISAFIASRLYAIFQTEFVYIIMFVITSILCIIVTSFIRIQPERKNLNITEGENITEIQQTDDYSTVKKKKKSQSKLALLVPLFKKFDVAVFLGLIFMWGMSYGAMDPFIYLYIDDIAPCKSRSIVGWMSLISATAEVVALFLAEKVLKKLGTHLSSIVILIAFAIRFGGYYFIREPYLLILMEAMHFFNFGVLFILITQRADAIAPPGLSSTLIGICLGLLFGLGRGSGLIVASFIYTLIEQRLLFLIFAIFNLILAVLYTIYFMVIRQRSNKSIEKDTSNISKVVIESDAGVNQEPLLTRTTTN